MKQPAKPSVPTIAREEFELRQRGARHAAAALDLEALLVWSRGSTTHDYYGDLLYLTNHHSPTPGMQDNPPQWSDRGYSALVLPTDDEPILISDTPEYRPDLVCVDDVRVSLNPADAAGLALKEAGVADGRVGIVGRHSLLHQTYERLSRAVDHKTEFVFADEAILDLRRVKSDAEVARMRYAAEVGIEWMNRTIAAVEPGRTEGDCVAEGLAYAVRRRGVPYDVAVTSGMRTERLHWARLPSWDNQRPLASGDLVHFDIWGPVEEYFTDFIRSTVAGGEANAAQKGVLDGAIGVIEAIIQDMKPGVSCAELYERGTGWLRDNGFGELGEDEAGGASWGASFPAFGHGIGLGIEPPWISRGEEAVLEPNMVMAVEALVGRDGVGAGGFEQDVLITDSGAEVLTEGCPARTWT